MRKPIIKKGDKYGMLTAIRFDYKDKSGHQHWLFRCSCGNEKVMLVNNVKRNGTISCGCLNRKKKIERLTTHGMRYSREYKTWQAMKNRCLNKNIPGYKDYGGRGITVCDKWKNSFENFYADMGVRPEGTSLDRIGNSKGYYKENCRWATVEEQANNMRSNHRLTYNGKTMTIAQWSRKLNFKRNTICSRLRYGWSVERTLSVS